MQRFNSRRDFEFSSLKYAKKKNMDIKIMGGTKTGREGKRSHVIRRGLCSGYSGAFLHFSSPTPWSRLWLPCPPLSLPLFPHVVRDRPRTFTFAIPLRPRVLHPPRLLPLVPPTLASHLQRTHSWSSRYIQCTEQTRWASFSLIRYNLMKCKVVGKREKIL